jgi:hypothetical protein
MGGLNRTSHRMSASVSPLPNPIFNDSTKFEYDPDRQVWQEFNEEDYRSDCGMMRINEASVSSTLSPFRTGPMGLTNMYTILQELSCPERAAASNPIRS